MRSTFHGLETARRAMATQQSALQTTGHNIANASTPGYTRQRVNFVQTEAYPGVGMNRPSIPGHLGTGVEAGSIQRVREGFLDTQFRGENSKDGFWTAKYEALAKIEDIMNEPSDNGLSKTLDQFWQSLQDLSVTKEGRSVVRQRGQAVAETFNYLSNSLSTIQEDIRLQTELAATEINSLTTQIDNINKQIKEVEPHGYLPNDLYDERDRLVDQLSGLVNIRVTTTPSGGLASPLAEGQYNIELLDKNGNPFTTPIMLLDSNTTPSSNTVSVEFNPINGMIDSVSVGNSSISVMDLARGRLRGNIEAYGYNNGSTVVGIYPEMLTKLDEMAFAFANAFNDIHSEGWSLDSIDAGVKKAYKFFDVGTAAAGAARSLKLHSDMDDLDHIAAARPVPPETVAYSGDGSNALLLSGVKNKTISFSTGTSTIQNFYKGVIGKLAVETQEADRLSNNSQVLKNAVDQRRASVSGVSIDEEMSNMIQYQHAYNAAARNISVVDEMLDTIIKGMGIGGR
ncbi:flagellar hook-associated protein FlgK [Fictibacillus sp. BK138]|uniref:flagellar hook-associated protein FlgK n=1 Tax=Fictibacillus sp. BK138 TaxID=2512121 RepID=UPI001029C692|nr:flagellar hook-associated protein FlgK [Fictibacillus sp. BK138]RZT15534.1 flagellar hook-associated protein 1 FlgK [Fictibacillus sp. BK138]